jgi:hypothetical protein
MPETHGYGEQFFRRYRELLDAEDCAFDELEHAYEDGDRAHFELDLAAWHGALERRHSYLERSGVPSPLATSAGLGSALGSPVPGLTLGALG